MAETSACVRLRLCDGTYLIVEAGVSDHADEDMVGLAGDLASLLGNVVEDANGNARTVRKLVTFYVPATTSICV